MKRVALIIAAASLALGGAVPTNVVAAASVNLAAMPMFKFQRETYDFGSVKEGPDAEYIFQFTNVGKAPLIVQSASASCACVTVDWPKEPILPGKQGRIKVTYRTQGRLGAFAKDIYLMTNAALPEGKSRYELHITGTVVS